MRRRKRRPRHDLDKSCEFMGVCHAMPESDARSVAAQKAPLPTRPNAVHPRSIYRNDRRQQRA